MKKGIDNFKKQLAETFKSIIVISLACLATIMVGNSFNKIEGISGWSTILINYVFPSIYTLVIISLFIRVVKIKRNMKGV
ncbi:hypothetical protein [Bacillus mycoides]|uniref:DUF2798 domain-containing protein n=1 Tax=Bacillus mycoides TaxID=1405 RepID=A0ABC9QUS9_BACMY|nr:hypothetical protein [Bacillus mycoides]EJR29161.1 hypothetical protein III_05966 [Bacillus mycoides]